MKFIEMNKERTKLFLYNQNGLQRTYKILFIAKDPQSSKQYAVFADPNDNGNGFLKINAAKVEFHLLSGSLTSFDEKISEEEWKFIHQKVQNYLSQMK